MPTDDPAACNRSAQTRRPPADGVNHAPW